MVEQVTIPKWGECCELRDKGIALNPLQQFIYDYDDADQERSRQFMSDVASMVAYVRGLP